MGILVSMRVHAHTHTYKHYHLLKIKRQGEKKYVQQFM